MNKHRSKPKVSRLKVLKFIKHNFAEFIGNHKFAKEFRDTLKSLSPGFYSHSNDFQIEIRLLDFVSHPWFLWEFEDEHFVLCCDRCDTVISYVTLVNTISFRLLHEIALASHERMRNCDESLVEITLFE